MIRTVRDRHGTAWYSGKSGAKKKAITEGRNGRHIFFVSRERPSPHDPRIPWRSFASFPDASAYYKSVRGVARGGCHDYEILEGPVRLMLDIDAVMPERDAEYFGGVLRAVEATVRGSFARHFNIADVGPCVVADGSRLKGAGAYKHSYHISFPRIVFDDTHSAMNAFAKRYLVPELRDGVPYLDADLDRLDERIYTMQRDWRLVGACKMGGGADAVLRMLDPGADRDSARCSGLSQRELDDARVRVSLEMVDALPRPRVFTWVSTLAAAKSCLAEAGPGVIMRRAFPPQDRPKNKFRAFETRADAASYIDAVLAGGAPVELHEIMQSGAARFLVWDIDWKIPGAVGPAPRADVVAMLVAIDSATRAGFLDLGVAVPDGAGGILDGSRSTTVAGAGGGAADKVHKHSYHMHYGPDTRVCFVDERAASAFVELLVLPRLATSPGIVERVDTGIHARNHGLRVAGASKLGDLGSTLRRTTSNGYTTSDYILSVADAPTSTAGGGGGGAAAAVRAIGADEVVAAARRVAPARVVDRFVGPRANRRFEPAIISPGDEPAVERAIEQLLAAAGDSAARVLANPTKRGIYVQAAKYRRRCLVAGGDVTHTSNAFYCTVKPHTGEVEMRCHSETCKGRSLIIGVIPTALCPRAPVAGEIAAGGAAAIPLGARGLLGFDAAKLAEGGPVGRYFEIGGAVCAPGQGKRYLGDLGPERFPCASPGAGPRILFVRSGMGTGKTKSLVDLLAARRGGFLPGPDAPYRHPRVVALSSRIQFTESTKARFAGLGFIDYNEKNIKNGTIGPLTGFAERMIYQGESLWKLDSWIRGPIDICVIDESESFLASMSSPTHGGNVLHNARALAKLVRASRCVIAMDADLGARSIDVVGRLVGERRMRESGVLVHNVSPGRPMDVKLHDDVSTFLLAFEAALDARENIFFVTGARRFAERSIVQEILAKRGFADVGDESAAEDAPRFRMYSAAEKDAQMHDFRDPNAALVRMCLCIITPKVTVGADFTVEHFDVTFCYGSHGSVSARVLFQMMGRNRNPRGSTIHAFFDAPMRGLGEATNPTTIPGAIDQLEARSAALADAERALVLQLAAADVRFSPAALLSGPGRRGGTGPPAAGPATSAWRDERHEFAWLTRMLALNVVERSITKRALVLDFEQQCEDRGFSLARVRKPQPAKRGREAGTGAGAGGGGGAAHLRREFDAANVAEIEDEIRAGRGGEILSGCTQRVRGNEGGAEDKARIPVLLTYALFKPGAGGVPIDREFYAAVGGERRRDEMKHVRLSAVTKPTSSYERWRDGHRVAGYTRGGGRVPGPDKFRRLGDPSGGGSDPADGELLTATLSKVEWGAFHAAERCAEVCGLKNAADDATAVTSGKLAESAAEVAQILTAFAPGHGRAAAALRKRAGEDRGAPRIGADQGMGKGKGASPKVSPLHRAVRLALNAVFRSWHSGELRPVSVVSRRTAAGGRQRESSYAMAFPNIGSKEHPMCIASLLPDMTGIPP
jgi:hypothetical protein